MHRSTILPLLLLASLPSQAHPPADGRLARLQRALEKTAARGSVAFTAKLVAKPAPPLGADRPWRTIRGSLAGGVLHVRSADDQELLVGGRLALVRGRGEEWRIRAGRGSVGDPVPYAFDPTAFLAAVRAAPLAVARAEVEVWKGTPYEVFSVTFDGDAAREFVRVGVLPYPDAIESSTVFQPVGAEGKVVAKVVMVKGGVQPATTVDLAFHIDPASSLVHRILARVTDPSGGAAADVGAARVLEVRVGGEPQPRVQPATPPDAPPRYEEGLPVRAGPTGAPLFAAAQLEVELSQFDAVQPPDLDPKARALLGLR